jgi:hypothetical protein
MNQLLPLGFQINTEVRVDFKAKTDAHFYHYPHSTDSKVILFNIQSGMCCIGVMGTNDGGVSYFWVQEQVYGFRDNSGLQFYDQHMSSWRYFDDKVQEAYAQYVLENEALK